MTVQQESPLRGWKQILEFMKVQDRRTAIAILEKKKILMYEGKTPVLLASVYQMTLIPAKRR
jgi:hypothetical protein